MHQSTRLQILEEIAAKVAEMNVIGNGRLSDDIITKAFSLQSEKKRNEITAQSKPKTRTRLNIELSDIAKDSVNNPVTIVDNNIAIPL